MLLSLFARSSLGFVARGTKGFSWRPLTSVTTDAAEGTAMPLVKELPVKYNMEEIVSLCKRRGIIFPSSEIYNGYAGFYDYGPLGCELKKNVKDAWWRFFVTSREDVVGLDSSIIHNPATWKSSGKYNWIACRLAAGESILKTDVCFCFFFRSCGWFFGPNGGLQGNETTIPSRPTFLLPCPDRQ